MFSNILVQFLAVSNLSRLVNPENCSAQSVNVDIICTRTERWIYHTDLGDIMSCLNIATPGPNTTVSSVPDASVTSFKNSNAQLIDIIDRFRWLQILGGDVKFIPKNIEKFLPNLIALDINNAGLLGVTKENLKGFGENLVRLSLQGNRLTSLNADLFEYNPNMNRIILSDNPFRHIDPDFFINLKNLGNLTRIDLRTSNCINQTFSNSTNNNIVTFKWTHNCYNETARVESMLWPINGRAQHSLSNEICLEQKFEDSESMIISLKNTVQTLVEDNMQLKKSVKKTNCRIDSIDAKLEKIIKILESD